MNQEKEISFFKKIIISIKDFEKYPELASKRWGVVLSYLLKLLVLFAIVIAFALTYQMAQQLQTGLQYIKEEIPEFTYANKQLNMDSDSLIQIENMDNLFVDKIMIDTQKREEETIEGYKQSLQKAGNGILLLKEKAFIKTQVTEGMIEYSYEALEQTYPIQDFTKEQVLQYFSGTNLFLIYVGMFIMFVIYMFLLYAMSIGADIILLGLFGFLTALFMRLHLRFSAMCKIAIHSLTLPILLNAVAILLDTFFHFKIQYSEVMYMGIAYIYIITAILMIKSDILKNQKELMRMLEEQEKVKQEMEKQKEEEERQKEEQKREKQKEEKRKKEKEESEKEEGNLGGQPQGENA